MIVVSDSTILIGLVKIGKLHLLREIFSKIFVPEEVFREVVERGKGKPGSKVFAEPCLSERSGLVRRNCGGDPAIGALWNA